MTNSQDIETKLPISMMFLKGIISALGIVLIIGFAFVMGLILLGGKYFVEQSEFEPYKLAKKITLEPKPSGDILSAKTSPIGIEVLYKQKGKLILSVYDGQGGGLLSEIDLQ